ncbi:Zn-dependent hydrolase [Prauserella marina]|uniref:Glyoxylase, beta-lactamase superfamily II n=1 Tax=Prauserella marina TaxID=530584 RepID=A0A222VVN0_9PSEU|nr:MBL fold metallo-hydrolase [Prauserella marina]ASR37989.1 Zn-dependent hydrolase [Prauserella marina]PWV73216.1 glyoxylase-like metal-dependent hydrolase (beta-lactamase superfamily II) [Prauserella marina]SDD69108.1 Glyoxylase, beta-lactamase superfamily II [Prauserella marina]
MAATVQNVVTSGVFELDGGSWEVENNVWIVGDDKEVIVIDAAHDAKLIADAVGGRAVKAIVSTHAHNDHVNAAPELARLTGAPIWLHPDDRVLWDLTHPGRAPEAELAEGQVISVGGTELKVIHTPGHAPGAVCLYAADLGAVFAGDTLFHGGPGATGRSYSDYPTIVASIREKLFALPDETTVHTGHGEHTTIGAEKQGSAGW